MTERRVLRPGQTTARIHIGCAGWSLPAQVATPFPAGASHLERYAAIFDCVEINSSFYRPHRAQTYVRWADAVPEAFRFSVKLPRTISHERKLHDPRHEVLAFLSQVAGLGPKLGCLLLQLPPSLVFDEPVADAFFTLLGHHTQVPLVCEPRHRSWAEHGARALMRAHQVIQVQADPSPVPKPENAHAHTQYLRLHGSPRMYRSAYGPMMLEALAGALSDELAAGTRTWVIFDNTASGAAIPDALALKSALDLGRG